MIAEMIADLSNFVYYFLLYPATVRICFSAEHTEPVSVSGPLT